MTKMIKQRLTRRQLFKASAFGAGALALPALGLASVAAAPSHEAQAAAEQPEGPAIPQPTFNPIASNTTFGPLTDISMGWDGTLWGIDAQGAPHIYDSINDVWAQHGGGIDAAAISVEPGQPGSGGTITLYVFQGPNVVAIDPNTLQASPPTTIAALWPNLPDSFKLGVSGAMSNDSGYGLLLFNAGRYISTDGTVPLSKLTDLANWPTNDPTFGAGVIDGASGEFDVLMRSGQVLQVSIRNKAVTGTPQPFSSMVSGAPASNPPIPAAWVASGVDAWEFLPASRTFIVFKGTAVFSYNVDTGAASPLRYLGNVFGNWPSTWHPVLRHAPNGRDGNLWSVLPNAQGSYTMQHNGDVWTQQSFQADHVGVGQDNAVMLASAQRLWTVTPNTNNIGYNVTSVSQANNLIQVSLGNANFVNARDTSGNVYAFNPATGALTQNTDVGTVAHIATTNDGSLWHAKPSDANMHRQLVGSGIAPAAIPVKQNLVTAVTKVAGTGFGAAHCLATDNQGNTDAYSYDSPYVFKTSTQYNVFNQTPSLIEQGAGLLFVTDNIAVDTPIGPVSKTQIAALDAHTGVEVARTPFLPNPLDEVHGQPVFDPVHNLVYVGTAMGSDTDNTTPGQLLALDARTLAVKWTFATTASIDAAPALNGTRLCVSDRTGKLYMFDTSAALAAAAQNPPTPVQPKWAVAAAVTAGVTHRIATPTFVGDVEDLIYTAVWACNPVPNGWGIQGQWVSYHVADGTPNDRNDLHTANLTGLSAPPLAMVLTAPAHGKLNISANASPQLSSALFYHCGDAVIAIGAGPTVKTFALPSGDYINTGFTYDAVSNDLWFGTANGALYCLNEDLNPINHTPYTTQSNTTIFTTPVLYKDPYGGTTVLFNATMPGAITEPYNLLGFDPVNGNIASLPTGVTRIDALSRTVTNGVVYAAGWIYDFATSDGEYPQIFALRVDQLPQAERDFIIESQLMQDPDSTVTGSKATAPDGNVIPPSVARYQTNLTVVDDDKNPLANEPVKIWADVDGTVITVNNTQYTIGPADNAYATVKTGIDGSMVITSDAKNTNASALRVWASFMNPFERIVVYPDHEWHGRSTQVNADDTVADPGKPNLNTVYKYDGTTLFDDSDRQQGTPTNVANAVGQMNTGLNPGGNSAASMAGPLKTLHASNPATPYIAYTTLGGMHYGPNNARAKRTATISAPIGFVLNKTYVPNVPLSSKHTYTPMSHSDARSAIDALDGKPWDPNNPSGKPTATASATSATAGTPVIFTIRRSDDFFTDFWNWLVGAFDALVDTIENVIVSVADDIMVGINFIIDGVKQAFKAIIKVIEDVCNAIASFFVQLLKTIEDFIAALSILFHFGEIIKTHTWLAKQVNQRVTDLTKAIIDTTTSPPTKGPILTNIDSFFAQGEAAVKGYFDSLRTQFSQSGNQPLNQTRGYGQTPHSAFTVGPKGQPPTSQATQCTWGTDRAKTNAPSATAGSSLNRSTAQPQSPQSPSATTGDPISDFFNGFIARLSTDPTLSSATNQLKNDFGNLFKAQSVSQFFSQLMVTLLDIVEELVIGALSIANALIDGLVAIIDDVIKAILAIINTEIQIPVLTWLYELLFGEPMTFLNVVTLVAAIPVTVVFRVVEGQYPSQAGLPDYPTAQNARAASSASSGLRPNRAEVASAPVLIAFGCFVGVCQFVQGIVNGLSDAKGAGDSPPALGYVSLVCGLLSEVFSFPLISSDASDVSTSDWAVYGIEVFEVIFAIAGLPYTRTDGTPNEPASTEFMSFGSLVLSIGVLAAGITAYVNDGKTDGLHAAEFGETVVEAIVGMFNPLKLAGELGPIVVASFDMIGGIIVAAITITTAIEGNTSPAPRQRRLFFPFVPHNPRPAQAHPLALGGAAP
jgi:hypothetical protein